MAYPRLPMRKIREILRLKCENGRSQREIARACGIANVVQAKPGSGGPSQRGLAKRNLKRAFFRPRPRRKRICLNRFNRYGNHHAGESCLGGHPPLVFTQDQPTPLFRRCRRSPNRGLRGPFVLKARGVFLAVLNVVPLGQTGLGRFPSKTCPKSTPAPAFAELQS